MVADDVLMATRAEPEIHLESATPEPHGGWRFVVRLDDGSLRGFTFSPAAPPQGGEG